VTSLFSLTLVCIRTRLLINARVLLSRHLSRGKNTNHTLSDAERLHGTDQSDAQREREGVVGPQAHTDEDSVARRKITDDSRSSASRRKPTRSGGQKRRRRRRRRSATERRKSATEGERSAQRSVPDHSHAEVHASSGVLSHDRLCKSKSADAFALGAAARAALLCALMSSEHCVDQPEVHHNEEEHETENEQETEDEQAVEDEEDEGKKHVEEEEERGVAEEEARDASGEEQRGGGEGEAREASEALHLKLLEQESQEGEQQRQEQQHPPYPSHPQQQQQQQPQQHHDQHHHHHSRPPSSSVRSASRVRGSRSVPGSGSTACSGVVRQSPRRAPESYATAAQPPVGGVPERGEPHEHTTEPHEHTTEKKNLHDDMHTDAPRKNGAASKSRSREKLIRQLVLGRKKDRKKKHSRIMQQSRSLSPPPAWSTPAVTLHHDEVEIDIEQEALERGFFSVRARKHLRALRAAELAQARAFAAAGLPSSALCAHVPPAFTTSFASSTACSSISSISSPLSSSTTTTTTTTTTSSSSSLPASASRSGTKRLFARHMSVASSTGEDPLQHRSVAVQQRLAESSVCDPRSEAEAHRRLWHCEQVTRVLRLQRFASHTVFVMPYYAGGDLLSMLREEGALSETDARPLFAQLCGALCAAHRQRIAHRDVKLENVLLDRPRRNAYLGDWGLAAFYEVGHRERCSRPGSKPYAAPELRDGRPYDLELVDVYALGCCLHGMVTGHLPAEGVRLSALSLPGHLSEACRQLLAAMLAKRPRRRLPVDRLLSHRWLCSPSGRVGFHSHVPEPRSVDAEVQAEQESAESAEVAVHLAAEVGVHTAKSQEEKENRREKEEERECQRERANNEKESVRRRREKGHEIELRKMRTENTPHSCAADPPNQNTLSRPRCGSSRAHQQRSHPATTSGTCTCSCSPAPCSSSAVHSASISCPSSLSASRSRSPPPATCVASSPTPTRLSRSPPRARTLTTHVRPSRRRRRQRHRQHTLPESGARPDAALAERWPPSLQQPSADHTTQHSAPCSTRSPSERYPPVTVLVGSTSSGEAIAAAAAAAAAAEDHCTAMCAVAAPRLSLTDPSPSHSTAQCHTGLRARARSLSHSSSSSGSAGQHHAPTATLHTLSAGGLPTASEQLTHADQQQVYQQQPDQQPPHPHVGMSSDSDDEEQDRQVGTAMGYTLRYEDGEEKAYRSKRYTPAKILQVVPNGVRRLLSVGASRRRRSKSR
jgi:serine/threonine protein kinase